jgi:hypothetical protein
MSSFSAKQRETLLQPIAPHRVADDGKGHAALEAYEVIAHLNRLFGFEGWSKEVTELAPVFESGEDRWTVAYRATVRLTVRDPEGKEATVKEDAAVGDAINQPNRADAHHLAVTSAVSVALKRCAKDLGDQFGLSLYDRGSFNQTVYRVVPYEEQPQSGNGEPWQVGGSRGVGDPPPADLDPAQEVSDRAKDRGMPVDALRATLDPSGAPEPML